MSTTNIRGRRLEVSRPILPGIYVVTKAASIGLIVTAIFLSGATLQAADNSPTSFPVKDIGVAGTPKLTPQQKAKVLRLVAGAPIGVRTRLRFAVTGCEGCAHNVVVVVDPGNALPDGTIGTRGCSQCTQVYANFKVLGDGCNFEFNPRRNFLFAASGC